MIYLKTAKKHLVVSHDMDDTLISSYIDMAVEAVEKYTSSIVKQREIVAYFDSFDEIKLKNPLISVTSIEYYNDQGVLTTLASSVYHVKTGEPVLHNGLYLAYDQVWPCYRKQKDTIKITYTAGYTLSTLPKTLEAAILLALANLYENREPISAIKLEEIPMSFNLHAGFHDQGEI